MDVTVISETASIKFYCSTRQYKLQAPLHVYLWLVRLKDADEKTRDSTSCTINLHTQYTHARHFQGNYVLGRNTSKSRFLIHNHMCNVQAYFILYNLRFRLIFLNLKRYTYTTWDSLCKQTLVLLLDLLPLLLLCITLLQFVAATLLPAYALSYTAYYTSFILFCFFCKLCFGRLQMLIVISWWSTCNGEQSGVRAEIVRAKVSK